MNHKNEWKESAFRAGVNDRSVGAYSLDGLPCKCKECRKAYEAGQVTYGVDRVAASKIADDITHSHSSRMKGV
jgi:hypothetical protein